jgi:ATP synthase protein I
MQSSDARIVRGAAIPAGLVGVAAVLLALPFAGAKGAVGAAVATFVVVAFFTISHVAVGYAAKVSPQTMMLAALASYVLKILAVMLLISLLNNVTAWNPKVFGWTVLALIATWIGGEIRTTLKSRTPYVDEPNKIPGDATSAVPEAPADRSG